ncbi:MAG: site-2 protease family protein [Candidatus Zixiibacteriota bacterium]|nr:MAG: site-2 protease family protein [candidate division Zixibacteria bacterium]
MASPAERNTDTVSRLLEDLFEIGVVYQQKDSLVISLQSRYEKERSIKLVSDRLRLAGYSFSFHEANGQLLIRINPTPRFRIPTINLVLFALTLVTVYLVPVFYKSQAVVLQRLAEADPAILEALQSGWQQIKISIAAMPEIMRATLSALGQGVGIEFTLALMSILLVHEMGHFLASRRRNIVTSWPYFIPAPNIIGTFGAIIKSKSPFWNRRDLIEVGAAGPIAGWIVAIGWLWYGLSQSAAVPADSFPVGELMFSLDGESILMKLSTLSLLGPVKDGFVYHLTEAAFAGWVGMLVTAINLLPIGQLDGGHILYGLGRRRQHLFGFVALGALLLLGMQSPIWWFFAIFGIVFGVKHPPTIYDHKKPGSIATGLGIVALIILIISFTPIPFRFPGAGQ